MASSQSMLSRRQSERRTGQCFLQVICLLICATIQQSDGFCIPPLFHQRQQRGGVGIQTYDRQPVVALCAANKKTGSGSKKTKRGAPPSPLKPKKKRKPEVSSSQQRSTPTAASQSLSSGTSRKKSGPPWQVLSKKDAKKNVEKELRRRDVIKKGIQPGSPEFMDEEDADDSPRILSKDFLSEPDKRLLNWKRFNPERVPTGMRFVGASLNRQLPVRLGVPEVAFLGRSNVGKSSLLNKLSASARSSATDQARVGKTPGATASVNLYALENAKGKHVLGWVDLPGFGYAKLSKDTKESVQQAAETYLGKRKELMLGILLVDIRREPSNDDRAVLAALFDMGVPIVVVATKVDKVSNTGREQALETIRVGLGLPEGQPLCVSSTTGEGTRDLWKIILEACEVGIGQFKRKYDKDAAMEQEQEEQEMATMDGEQEGEVFSDGEDLVYSQGFDWVHASGVVYEGDDDNYRDAEGDGEEEDWQSDKDGEDDEEPPMVEAQRETLKSLKRKVRDMQRRGEI